MAGIGPAAAPGRPAQLLPLALSLSLGGGAGVALITLGCALGTGFGLGLATALALLQRHRGAKKLGPLTPLLRLLGWPHEHRGHPGGGAAAPTTHYVLRPHVDPRLDKGLFVRYDPPPERRTGAIVVICPGGNYDESDVHGGEGQPVAQWLASLGLTSVVLQYRCVSQGHYWPAQFDDYVACIRRVQREAASWGCDASRIGVIGFSAGGHLAGYAALNSPPDLPPPAFQVLVYPAVDTLTPHEDGDIDPWDPAKGYPGPETSLHLHVGPGAPPAFLAGMPGDTYCPSGENTDVYAEALRRHGVPYAYVTDDEAEHGCGLQDWWTEPCANWLVQNGWASAQRDAS